MTKPPDKKKQRSSDSRKLWDTEEASGLDDNKGRRSSGTLNDSRKRVRVSVQECSGEDDDYDTRKELRSKQMQEKRQEENSLEDWCQEGGNLGNKHESGHESLSGALGRANEIERRNKVPVYQEPGRKALDKDCRDYEEKGSSGGKEKRDMELVKKPRRRWDEPDTSTEQENSIRVGRSDSGSGKSSAFVQEDSREWGMPSKLERCESIRRNMDSSRDEGRKSYNSEDIIADDEGSKSEGRLDTPKGTKQSNPAGYVDVGEGQYKSSNTDEADNSLATDKSKREAELCGNARTLERSGKHNVESENFYIDEERVGYNHGGDPELPRHGDEKNDKEGPYGCCGGEKSGTRSDVIPIQPTFSRDVSKRDGSRRKAVVTSSRYGITNENYDVIVIQTESSDNVKGECGTTSSRRNKIAGGAPTRGEENDYSQNFVDTGMRPQNFINPIAVVEDHPQLRELIQRKDEIVAKSAFPPMYYKCDLKEHVLTPEFFGTKFDVILVDPPWEEYVHRAPSVTDDMEYWSSEEIMNLKIEAIADKPSFIFLWVGDGAGLEQGRQCLNKWGFRRVEDICWVKTNKSNATPALRHDSHTLLQRSKEHCLMGIKGTIRRSSDGHVIHANIDIDVIIAEEPPCGSIVKPEDLYHIIEHFSLGRRRLELFGEDHNIRPGWLTVGKGLSSSNFNAEAYVRNFMDRDGRVWQGGRIPPPGAPHLVLTTPEIEALRPKSPAKN